MTDSQQPTPPGHRARTFQEDLLQDLQQTAPASDSPSSGSRTRAPRPAAANGRENAPTVEVRVTPTRWRSPSMRQAAGGHRMVLSAGPVSVSVDLPRR